MKKVVVYLGSIILSLIVTFVTFEALSWYHFGDIPTKIVAIRLIIFFCVVECLFLAIFAIIKKYNNK